MKILTRTKALSVAVGFGLILGLLAGCSGVQQSYAGADVVANLSGNLDEGFARAYEPVEFSFPLDHGAHPEFRTEWWYFTGNLQDERGDQYGYQFTVFRNALTPEVLPRESNLATNQIYLAHFAMTNVQAQEHVSFERFSRGDGNLSGAIGEPSFQVWLEDWTVAEVEPGQLSLTASTTTESGEEFGVDLMLQETRDPLLHGDRGLSQKGPEEGNASYYYSLVGLESAGTLTWVGEDTAVEGLSWMDHEYGSSALSENAVGWDWFSAQLDNGDVLMFAQIRTEDGGLVDEMQGTYLRKNGETSPLRVDDYELEALGEWTSALTGATYPSGWRVRFPALDIELEITPLLDDQEMRVSFVYWEGAVDVEGSVEGLPVQGTGFVELTGYGESAQGQRFQR
jgi:predicted secreted hydrolase